LNKLFIPALLTALPLWGQLNETWHAYRASHAFKTGVTVILDQDFRHATGALYYVHNELGISFPWHHGMKLSINYRQVFTRSDETWTPEFRPHFNVSTTKTYTSFTSSARARLEYRIKNNQTAIRNRDLVIIKTNHTFTPLQLVPYMADETFYDITSQEFNQNRFYAGVMINRFTRVKPTFYYLYQVSLKSGEWNGIHIAGIKISLK